MKLTRRLLAVVLSVAMLLGMVAVGATASITDYYEYDPVNNPYTAKIGLKAYKVNTEDGTYTEITDSAVEPGDVVRVEVWVQTNYYHTLSSLGIAYSNGLYVPTTLDYSTYSYLERASSVSYSKVFAMTEYDADHADSADGTIDNPWYLNEVVMNASSGYVGKTKAQNYANIKKYMPPAWRGTGTTATTYYADEKYTAYNYLYAGYMADTNYEYAPYAMNGIIVTEYQPTIYFNLTVSEDAQDGDSGIISIPSEGIYTSTQTASTYLARCYSTDEDGDGYGDEEVAAAEEGLQYIYPVNNNIAKDTYPGDDTVYERVYDMSEASITLTVGGGSTAPETTTEAPTTTEPVIEYANLEALKAAITAAEAADLTNRTSASLADYNAALAAAEALVASTPLLAQQDEVNAAAETLNTAVANLAYLGACDYDDLDAAIAAYEAKLADKANYTAASWAEYEAAYNEAKAVTRDMVADEAGANQAIIDAAEAKLSGVVLVALGTCNYEELDAAIAAYEAKLADKANYTAASWAEYEAAYNEAKAVTRDMLADEAGANQAIIDAAEAKLSGVVLVALGTCNYEELDAAIAAYEAKLADKANYTAASWAEYEAAYNEAKAVTRDMLADEAGANQAIIDAAEAKLSGVVLVALGTCNYEELDAAIAAYEAKLADKANYTAASWAEYEAAYNEAKAVTRDMQADEAGANQAIIDAAEAKLSGVVLVALGTCNYEALDAQISAYEELVKADYKPASWTESGVDAAYEAAKAVARDMIADEDGANQATIDNAAAALKAAIAKLDKVANKEDLAAAISAANLLVEDDYTPDSWADADLATAIAEAEAVYADADADDVAVAEAIAALEAAKALLQKKADKALLAEKLAAAKELKEESFTPDSWADADLELIITEAQGVYDNENADADDVANAIAALESAVGQLVAKADKAALKAAIETVVDTENCEAATVEAYEKALAEAKDVYANENATQNEVNEAEAALLAAIGNVKKLGTCDYAELDAAIAAAGEYTADAYTTSSWAAADLATVIAAAEAVEKNMVADEAGANQATIDNAKTAIDEAIAKLEEKADMAALEAAIAAEPTVAEEYATAGTWADYAAAKADAEALLANAADTGVSAQETVNAAAEALNKANAALVEESADYAAVEAAIAKIPADLSGYTAKTVKALNDAVDAVVYGLGKSKQNDVNAYAAAIEKAIGELAESKAAVTDVDVDLSDYLKKGTKDYTIKVTGAPSKIQIINSKGTTATYDRYNKYVKEIVSYNAEGEVINYADEEPAYEVWTITMSLAADTYQVKAKFGRAWDTFTYEFDVKYVDLRAAAVTFVAKDAASEEEAAKAVSVARRTPVQFTVTVPTQVTKVQLVYSNGATATYAENYATVVANDDGTETWTITRAISTAGEYSVSLKLKDKAGWYDAVTEAIELDVTK